MKEYPITFTEREIAAFTNWYFSQYSFAADNPEAPEPNLTAQQAIGKILYLCERDDLLKRGKPRITVNE